MAEELIIDINIDADGVVERIADINNEIAKLEERNKELNSLIKEGSGNFVDYNKELSDNKVKIEALSNANSVLESKVSQTNKDMADATKQTVGYSESVQGATNTIGGMPKVLDNLIPNFNKISGTIKNLGVDIKNFGAGGVGGFKAIGNAAMSFGKAILAPPVGVIVVILAAILLVINKLKDAFAKNSEATDKLKKSMAAFQPILTILNKVFSVVADVIAMVVEKIVGFVSVLIKANPIVMLFTKLFPDISREMDETSKRAVQLAEDTEKLKDAQEDFAVQQAKNAKETEELLNIVNDKENQSVEDRKKALERIKEMKEEELTEQKRIAEENLRILKEQQSLNVDYSEETNKKIKEAQAEVYNATARHTKGLRELQKDHYSQMEAIDNEAIEKEKERQQRAKEWTEKQKELDSKLEQAKAEHERVKAELIQDGEERELASMELRYEEQRKNLNKRIAEVKGNSEKEKQIREELNAQLLLLDEKQENDKLKIEEKYRRLRNEDFIKHEYELIQRKMYYAKEFSEEYLSLETDRLNNRQQKEEAELNNMLADNLLTQEEYEAKLSFIQDRYNNERLEAQKEYSQRKHEAELESFSATLERMRVMADESLTDEQKENRIFAIDIETTEQEYEYLFNLDEETKSRLFDSQESYEYAVLESYKRMTDASRAYAEHEKKLTFAKIQMAGDLANAMMGMFREIAGESELYATFQKAMAIFEASMNLAGAIAAATSKSTQGDPYTMAIRIAANVAAVVASFAAAVSSIKNSEIPKYEHGGFVGGVSYQGDKVPIMVNSGEVILNAEQQRRFMSLANGSLVPTTNYNMFIRAFENAISKMPAPILDYNEFTDFQKQVIKVQEYANV